MLAKEFFRSISSGQRTGELRFRNGDYAYVTSKNLSTNMSGDIYTVTVPLGFKETIKLEYNDDWKLIPILQQGNGPLSDWDVVSAKFNDMAYYVEQVSAGKMKGYFYTALGEKLRATQDTVKTTEYFHTLRKFTIVGPSARNYVVMYYTVDLCADVCVHGQVAGWNLIDFIEDDDV
jgi:hypothetical protein